MRYRYKAWDPRLLDALRQFKDLLDLFNHLLLKTGGDVDRALDFMRHLQEQGYLPEDVDLEKFRDKLEEEGFIQLLPEGTLLTAKGERRIRRDSLEAIFGALGRGGEGEHPTPHDGSGGPDTLPEKRPFEFGDSLQEIDFTSSIQNALRRGSWDMQLTEQDLEVRDTEHSTACATVLMLDVSHSMVLYGEDRITPAKQVALALAEMIMTSYRKDSLDVVLFGDEALPVKVKDLVYVGAGPFHTNTQEGLRYARRILEGRRQPNKQIFMITDGKPTVVRLDNHRLYRNVMGPDVVIETKTLDEARMCRRRKIPITTFMLATDPDLQAFVRKMTEVNRGRAYMASLDRLGGFVFMDFIANRRKRVR